DRAAVARPRDRAHNAIVEVGVQDHLVAAHRVALVRARLARLSAPVRVLGVVEDEVLVERLEVVHHAAPKKARTPETASSIASMSDSVLGRKALARPDAGRPKRRGRGAVARRPTRRAPPR